MHLGTFFYLVYWPKSLIKVINFSNIYLLRFYCIKFFIITLHVKTLYTAQLPQTGLKSFFIEALRSCMDQRTSIVNQMNYLLAA